ncbi:MAG: NAD-dependent epimerase/dehydratase family protein [Gammaproteobacteria bacterium AqS3]|nr:NAD-dependent epimerase/dehydratase family protein [Gammaproteobacteria bacterium AqS3]
MSSRIAVIGASGFIGSHVAVELIARGHDVTLTARDPRATAAWLVPALKKRAPRGTLYALMQAELDDADSIEIALEGCSGLICCAGTAKAEPATVELMLAAVQNICSACLTAEVPVAVFTSSTGSMNPPGDEPELKNELDHWSDDAAQIAAGKFGPAGKTRLDRGALAAMQESGGRLRTAVINPSLVTGPVYQPDPVGQLRLIRDILKGERMAESIPNDSMSIIDVRDLAQLHIAALLNPNASGRYFGVKRSWHWREILAALQRCVPGYSPPPVDPEEVPIRPTGFDLTRRDSLGVPLRDLDEILQAVVDELNRRGMLD